MSLFHGKRLNVHSVFFVDVAMGYIMQKSSFNNFFLEMLLEVSHD